MDLQAYLKVLHKHWRVIPIVTLVVLAATAGVTYLMPKSYQSQLQFFVSTVDSGDNGQETSQLAQGNTFLQQRVLSYTQLLKAPVVLQPVVNKVGLATTPKELAPHVSATIPTDTVLINVTVTDSSPSMAERIASAIGDQFPKTVADLERVSAGGQSPVKVTVTQPPTIDATPISPNPVRNLALGVILGLVIAISFVLVRNLLDTKVRTKEDVGNLTDVASVIGTIPFDPQATESPLLTDAGRQTTRSESFRGLRTNLAFVGTAARARAIVMTSSLPGEGKTTTTANLGMVLAETGASVCLVEADLRRPRLLDYFGMEGAVGLTDLLIGRADLADILQPYGRHQLALLGAGQIPPNPSELLGSPAMGQALQELTEKFDYVLLDAPPMLPVTDAAVLSTISDGAVIVVGSGLVTRDQLTTAIEGLEKVNTKVLGVVMNRMPRNVGGRYYDYKYDYSPRRERSGAPDAVIDWDTATYGEFADADESTVASDTHERRRIKSAAESS